VESELFSPRSARYNAQQTSGPPPLQRDRCSGPTSRRKHGPNNSRRTTPVPNESRRCSAGSGTGALVWGIVLPVMLRRLVFRVPVSPGVAAVPGPSRDRHRQGCRHQDQSERDQRPPHPNRFFIFHALRSSLLFRIACWGLVRTGLVVAHQVTESSLGIRQSGFERHHTGVEFV
jgi:hypothetical protein